MMDLEAIRIFVKVAQEASFTRASEALRLPKSTVSKTVSRLEEETGTKLIMRTTRNLSLTDAGRSFYEASLGPIHALEEASKELYGRDQKISGQVRLTAPEDLGTFVIAPVLADLLREHPTLSFELIYTNQILDLVKDGFDLAVRIGSINESQFKIRRLGELRLILIAAPSYLRRRGNIREPSDLSSHDCLSLADRSTYDEWNLRAGQKKVDVKIKAKALSNQMSSLVKLALAGGGVALVPPFLATEDIAAGRLIHVLPAWSKPSLPVSMISPLGAASSARLKLTMDHLQTKIRSALDPR